MIKIVIECNNEELYSAESSYVTDDHIEILKRLTRLEDWPCRLYMVWETQNFGWAKKLRWFTEWSEVLDDWELCTIDESGVPIGRGIA